MSKLVQIPEAALEALLREAGHPESVAAYLASSNVQTLAAAGQRLVKRANAAYWSRFWLFLSAAVSWLGFVSGPDIEGFIACVLLTGMTVVEYKVYHFFLAADVRGAIWGWWNQCLFAALFLIYGGYHGTFVTVPPLATSTLADLGVEGLQGDLQSQLTELTRLTYYTIALVGGVAQFSLAWYYRRALR
jgi:hypothetical protein